VGYRRTKWAIGGLHNPSSLCSTDIHRCPACVPSMPAVKHSAPRRAPSLGTEYRGLLLVPVRRAPARAPDPTCARTCAYLHRPASRDPHVRLKCAYRGLLLLPVAWRHLCEVVPRCEPGDTWPGWVRAAGPDALRLGAETHTGVEALGVEALGVETLGVRRRAYRRQVLRRI
jgi:hypothetical protein